MTDIYPTFQYKKGNDERSGKNIYRSSASISICTYSFVQIPMYIKSYFTSGNILFAIKIGTNLKVIDLINLYSVYLSLAL